MGDFLHAAEKVLEMAGKPLCVAEITALAMRHGLLQSRGKTPHQTMKSKIATDIRTKQSGSRFQRTGPGRFALRRWALDEFRSDPYVKRLLDEEIVVIPRGTLRRLLPSRPIARLPVDYPLLLRQAFPMSRQAAEQDTRYIQLVSVFVVTFGPEVLTYKRSKRLPETRLHGEYSLFFGGHVTPSDLHNFGPLFDPFAIGTVGSRMHRELSEELTLQAAPAIEYVGLLYDDSREVSRLHLGIVFLVALADREFEVGERGFLIDPRFETAADVRARLDEFENWSQLILLGGLVPDVTPHP